MAKYLIESPHTKEECLQTLDEMMAKGSDTLNRFYFGCDAGDHTAYAIVDASSESVARAMVPSFVEHKVRVRPVGQYTPDQIRSFHRAA